MNLPKPEQSKLALAMTLGGVMSSNIIGGIIVGYVLDKWLGTNPLLIISGVVLGTVGALVSLYRITSRLNEK
jgi:F0F1-type ATP synthase assembly protein I